MTISNVSHRLFATLVVSSMLFISSQSVAAPLPAMNGDVRLLAREITAVEFLERLFGQINVPVIVDPRVDDSSVNGDFIGSAASVFKQTMDSLQLVTYYDGAVAYVYNANAIKQVVMPLSPSLSRKVAKSADRLGLADEQNMIRSTGDTGLIAMGTPRYLDQLNELSVSARRNTRTFKPRIIEKMFYLRHAWAHDTTLQMGQQSMRVRGIVSILNELIGAGPGIEQGGFSSSGDVAALDSELALGVSSVSITQNEGSQGNNPPPVQRNRDRQSGFNGQAIGGQLSGSVATRIVPVQRLNAVLVRDYENRMSSYASLIQSLDIEPYQLEIEATIIDVKVNRTKEVGVNWRYTRGDGNEALVGNGTFSDQLLNPGNQITPQGKGGILSLALGNGPNQFLARIRALEQSGDAEIVSKPHVVTLANQEAVLTNVESFFLPIAAKDDAALFKVTVGTTLRVTPHVYRLGGKPRIKMMVSIEDGASTDQRVGEIPVIGQSTLNTQAIISEGDSLLVGGLVRESKRDYLSKVPVLGDIPGLGNIFRSKTTSGEKIERLFMITPRLSLRQGFGKRLERPILEGNQGEILGTSGQRMEPTVKALQKSRKAAQAPLMTVPQPAATPLQGSPILINEPARPKASNRAALVKNLLIVPQAPVVAGAQAVQLQSRRKFGVKTVEEGDWEEIEQTGAVFQDSNRSSNAGSVPTIVNQTNTGVEVFATRPLASRRLDNQVATPAAEDDEDSWQVVKPAVQGTLQ